MKPYLFISFIVVLMITTFFLQGITQDLSATNLHLELLSLQSLKSSLRDPQSTFNDWDTNLTFSKSDFQDPVWCSWSGIKCHSNTTQITSLDLSNRNLSGSIPLEIQHLSSLIHLNLSGNNFTEPFPMAIFELTQLRTLDISSNHFSSTFPPGISKLKFLKVLDAFYNNFTGPLPQEATNLQFLESLDLSDNLFTGSIPASYGNFSQLKYLDIAGNILDGPIPSQLALLTQLESLELGSNSFSGGIPSEFSLLTKLDYLNLVEANLSGTLPQSLGNMTMLRTLLLYRNNLSGKIPKSLGNMKALELLDLSENQFSGTIPSELSNLKELTNLGLKINHLSGEIPQAICQLPNLVELQLWNNSLTGPLPGKFGNNGKLVTVDVSSNMLTGPIPPNICRGNQLSILILFSNRFVNEFPPSLANCTSLSRLRIQNNYLSGSIPYGYGWLQNLTFVDLSSNNFSGAIPANFGNAAKLQYLNISKNSFETSLPDNIWNSTSILIFSASSSKIVGKIHDFIGCTSVYKIELQDNNLNGFIPQTIGHCEKLLSLDLSRNSLTGNIPLEIATLPSITAIDLSHNFLTGSIPQNFQNIRTLINFNVSHNKLTGPIPSTGTLFPYMPPSSFSGNDDLCGPVIEKPCSSDRLSISDMEVEIVLLVTAAFGIWLLGFLAATRWFKANYDDQEIGHWELTAFQCRGLNFTADDVLECLSMTDEIIGTGSTATVYKAKMPGGEIIAVKKLWGDNKGSTKRGRGVLAEVAVLRNLRHRNIVRLLGCCSNMDSVMLLYEYMPNGNLHDLLHGKNNKGENLVVDWLTRYKIALGVAEGMCYLHHDCDPVIVHRDLKPYNILLDDEMEARVADFGVAKLIHGDESMSVIAGTSGYIAPEYIYAFKVDEKSDIYSYGVVLMEILSRKRPSDSKFGDGNSIVDWVRSKIKIKDGLNEILDDNIGTSCASFREEMIQMFHISLLCTSCNPVDRPSMREVVMMLQEVKHQRKLRGKIISERHSNNNSSNNGDSHRS